MNNTALLRDTKYFYDIFLLNGMSLCRMATFKASNTWLKRTLSSTQERKNDEPTNINHPSQLKPFLTFFTKGNENRLFVEHYQK